MSLSCEKFKKEARDSFLKRNYKMALLNYSFALKESPIDKEAKLGAILADMASEQEEEAVALFDFYEIEKSKKDSVDVEKKIENIINLVDDGLDEFNYLFGQFKDNNIDELKSISYGDFLEHITNRGSFKLAFEDIIFSTKVIISQKDDLINFIKKLIDNGFREEALNYIENYLKIYPKDIEFRELLEKISRN